MLEFLTRKHNIAINYPFVAVWVLHFLLEDVGSVGVQFGQEGNNEFRNVRADMCVCMLDF